MLIQSLEVYGNRLLVLTGQDPCRYDSGCQDITNVDFSKLVIASMMRRNLRQRPRMKWKVGDMTDLQVFHILESFDTILQNLYAESDSQSILCKCSPVNNTPVPHLYDSSFAFLAYQSMPIGPVLHAKVSLGKTKYVNGLIHRS